MKVCSTSRQVFGGRAYLCLFCVLTLGTFVGLSCNSGKRCIRPAGPDLPRLEPTTWLDLDEDGSSDFVFEYSVYQTDDVPSSEATNLLSVRPLGNNRVHYKSPHGCVPLPDSTLIDGALGWSDFEASLAGINWRIQSGWEAQWGGFWAGASQMNLGLQLLRGNSTYFGWAKLSVDAASGSLTVHDYAYNHRAGLPIRAGVRPPLYCTEIGCPSAYSLFLRPRDTRFPAGRYEVHITPEGETTRSCSFVVSEDPAECAAERCVTTQDCNAVYMVGYPDRDWVMIDYPSILVPIEVVIGRDGAVVGKARFKPVYETFYPNGPECPGMCMHAENELVVD